MKKFIQLMFLLPLLALVGCSDDNDYPQVDITVSMGPASLYNNVVYIVKGEDFTVNSISVASLDGKASALGSVGYYWNNVLSSVTNIDPYVMAFDTSTLPLGRNLFQIRTNVFQVDKTVTAAWMSYNVVVVESADKIPEGAPALGEVRDTMRCTPVGDD